MKMSFDRITIDPKVCFGKPCLRGTRFTVAQVVDLVAAGNSIQQILSDFPNLQEEDIHQALAYAAALVKSTEINLKVA
jgi:uncharacterized protein (DUF433 family)